MSGKSAFSAFCKRFWFNVQQAMFLTRYWRTWRTGDTTAAGHTGRHGIRCPVSRFRLVRHFISHMALSALAILCLQFPVAAATTQAPAKTPAVVATIAPLHSLVSALLQGTEPAHLLLASAASVHSYALKPSDARHLSEADIIVQIGPGLEGFLQKTLATVATSAELISVADSAGTTLLAARGFDARGDEIPSTGDSPYDAHLWLDPLNNLGWLSELTEHLIQQDPANASIYEKNRLALTERLNTLDTYISATLSSVAGQRFIAQHDSYQYLEKRYGLGVIGVMLDTHEQRMGIASLRALTKRAKDQQARCIVTAPGSTTSVLESVSGLANIPQVEIDILGTKRQPGPELYFELMRDIAGQLTTCLSPSE